MGYIAEIRRNADGLVRQHHEASDWTDGEDFIWFDGNSACDCQRAAFFARAAGEPDPNHPCSSSEYTVLRFILPDGTELRGDTDEHAT